MENICTYFYQELSTKKSSYANISGKKNDVDLTYWKTVYTFFYTSIIINKDINHVFFTNVPCFPFRREIELLGVTIYDDLTLSYPNEGKWASVKFFFDVINFIHDSEDFLSSDNFAMFDTDCIALNSFSSYFELIKTKDAAPLAYLNGVETDSSSDFHGESLDTLQKIYEEVIGTPILIQEKIGGEFFAFNKGEIKKVKDRYSKLLASIYGNRIRTEEQILSMINAEFYFTKPQNAISRLWTTIRYVVIPKGVSDFAFVHLPSEKQTSLPILFSVFLDKNKLNQKDLKKLVLSVTSIESRYILIMKRFYRIFKRKVANEKV